MEAKIVDLSRNNIKDMNCAYIIITLDNGEDIKVQDNEGEIMITASREIAIAPAASNVIRLTL